MEMREWPRVRLGQLLRLRKDVVHPRDNPVGKATFVGLEHVEGGTGRRIGSVEVDMAQLTGRKPRFYAGDIVYGYLRPYLNKVWVADFDGLCSVDQYVYSVVPGLADPAFIAWFMRSPTYLAAAPIRTTPGQLPRIRTEEVAGVEMHLPPLTVQQTIVARLTEQLTAVEQARAAAEAQLQAERDLPAAYLRAAFASESARKWPTITLAECATVSGGIQKAPQRSPQTFHRPYLTVRNVQQGYLDLAAVERFEVTPAELARLRLMPGDILVVEGNGSIDQIGRNALYNGEIDDCIHQNHLIRVRVEPTRAVPRFISFYLNSSSGRAQLVEKAKSTTGLHTLSVSKIQSLTVPMPDLAVQQGLVATLSTHMDAAYRIQRPLAAQLAAIEKLPAALLRQAFAGEI